MLLFLFAYDDFMLSYVLSECVCVCVSVCLLKPIGKLMFIQCEASMSSFYNRNLTQGCFFYKLVVLFYMVQVFFVVCVHESFYLFFPFCYAYFLTICIYYQQIQ